MSVSARQMSPAVTMEVNSEGRPLLQSTNTVSDGRGQIEEAIGSSVVENILKCLADNENVQVKSQQRGESDLGPDERLALLREMYDKSRYNFLYRFGTFLSHEQLEVFEHFQSDHDSNSEIGALLNSIRMRQEKSSRRTDVRNRRYAALKQLVEKNSYFSEKEMMKRNPLLYDQLVGQYLSKEEKKERDAVDAPTTFVEILMEGIEKDRIEKLQNTQEDDEEGVDSDEESKHNSSDSDEDFQIPCSSHWGEFDQDDSKRIRKRKPETQFITGKERKLLKEEFVTTMYQSFLDGKDADYDYGKVDSNDDLDDLQAQELDEEEKYFDSEDPEEVEMDQDGAVKKAETDSSEDELETFMSALNQHPLVTQLSQDMKRL